MNHINFSKLNPFEQQIYDQLLACSKLHPDLKITQAAELCGCSISKISKFVKKLGFTNYKQFMDFLYGREIQQKKVSSELERIKLYINDFDSSLVDEFIDMMGSCERLLLFGYGPSLICAQYFEYRLRTTTGKLIKVVGDEISVETMADQNTMLVIFTTTGTFRSFENLYRIAKAKGCRVLIIAEEYNTSLLSDCDRIFWLCKYPQPADLKPHEKSRTVFFIFIEEIINKLMNTIKAN